MDSQEKLSQLINKVYDYSSTIKQTIFNNKPLSDNQVVNYYEIKQKCLQSLRDIILLTGMSKVTSATSDTLSNVLFGISSADQLNRNTLQKAVNICDVLKKNIIIDDVIYKAKEEKAVLIQSELISLKKLFGLSDTFVLEKSTSTFFFDDSMYETMNIGHIQLIVDELSRIQTCFLGGKLYKSYVPIWLFKFLYALNDFVVKKHKKAQAQNDATKPPPNPEFLVKKRSMPVDFDLSYKHLENFLSCDSYISARDLCQDMIAAFPDHEGTPELRKKLENIQEKLEEMKRMFSSPILGTDKISVPTKRIDPGLVDPTTGRIKDDFF